MFWIAYDPLWDLYASTVWHVITHQSTNLLAYSKGGEMEKLAHWSGLIRKVTFRGKRPSAEWWSDCSLVDCLICWRPQWQTRLRTGTTGRTFGPGWNRVKRRAAVSIGVNRGQMFPGDRCIKKQTKRKQKEDSKVLTDSEVCTTNNRLYDISSICWTLFKSSPADLIS